MRMFARYAIIPAVVIGAVALTAGLTRANGPEPLSLSASETLLPVAAMTVRRTDNAVLNDRFAGIVQPSRQSALGFEAGGRVAGLKVDVADRVKAGDELARLDLRTLDAQIAAARAQIREAEAAEQLSRVTFDRQKTLVDKGHASPQRLDEARANIDAARARAEAAEASVQALMARRQLSILTAPFDGVITERFLDEGAIAGPGQAIFSLVETGALELRVGIPIDEMQQLKPGDSYPVEIDGRSVSATLRAMTGVVEERSQTVTAIFDIAESEGVAAGSVARVQLENTVGEEGYWIPFTALAEGARGLWTVIHLEPDNGAYRTSKRLVDILFTDGDRVFVRGSIEDGDRIIASGVARVVSGQRVRAVGREDEALASAAGR